MDNMNAVYHSDVDNLYYIETSYEVLHVCKSV